MELIVLPVRAALGTATPAFDAGLKFTETFFEQFEKVISAGRS